MLKECLVILGELMMVTNTSKDFFYVPGSILSLLHILSDSSHRQSSFELSNNVPLLYI